MTNQLKVACPEVWSLPLREGQASMNPEPETLASIKSQGTYGDGTYQCGCEQRGPRKRWWLCQYHEGFDDAIATIRPPEAP